VYSGQKAGRDAVELCGGPPTGIIATKNVNHIDACNHVGDARIALAHNIGGPTAVSAVTILEGPGAGGE
jgi:hypothetical protein